jgi:hypothetical protein
MSKAFAGVGSRVQGPGASDQPPVAVIDEPQVSQGPVTFYHWIDKYPSSEIIHVSGGEKRISADGQAILLPEKAIHFHNGMYTTSDPEEIALMDLRGPAWGITRDREEYYSHVLSANERLRRQAGQVTAMNQQLEERKKEEGRLRAKLEAAGISPD